MSVEIVKGDAVKAVLNGDTDFLVHCCNAQGVMGSGIAKQVKDQIPETYEAYRLRYATKGLTLGDVIYSEGVFNLIGQDRYGYDGERYCHYGAIAKGFNTISQMTMAGDLYKKLVDIPVKSNYSIALPYKFACDRAGGDWEVVEDLIETLLGSLEVKIYQL